MVRHFGIAVLSALLALPALAGEVRGSLRLYSTSLQDLDPADGIAAAAVAVPGWGDPWSESTGQGAAGVSFEDTGITFFANSFPSQPASAEGRASSGSWLEVTPHTSLTFTAALRTYTKVGDPTYARDEVQGLLGLEMHTDGGVVDASHATLGWSGLALDGEGPNLQQDDWVFPADAPKLWITFTNDTDQPLHVLYGFRAMGSAQTWTSPVPEPSGALLLGAGLALLPLAARRHTRRR